jgi:hypothetical protein
MLAMTSTLLLGLITSSLEATIYQENLDRNRKPDINQAREIYLTCKCYWNVAAYVSGKLRIRTLKSSLL